MAGAGLSGSLCRVSARLPGWLLAGSLLVLCLGAHGPRPTRAAQPLAHSPQPTAGPSQLLARWLAGWLAGCPLRCDAPGEASTTRRPTWDFWPFALPARLLLSLRSSRRFLVRPPPPPFPPSLPSLLSIFFSTTPLFSPSDSTRRLPSFRPRPQKTSNTTSPVSFCVLNLDFGPADCSPLSLCQTRPPFHPTTICFATLPTLQSFSSLCVSSSQHLHSTRQVERSPPLFAATRRRRL